MGEGVPAEFLSISKSVSPRLHDTRMVSLGGAWLPEIGHCVEPVMRLLLPQTSSPGLDYPMLPSGLDGSGSGGVWGGDSRPPPLRFLDLSPLPASHL